jgi:uncharacterized protein (TIRG00374 family)
VFAGLAIGIVLVWLLFRNTDWSEVWDSVRGAHLGWVLVATGLVILSFFLRVMRWTYIVRAAKPVKYRHLFSATQIGFLANFTLPARIGEVIRAVVLSRLEGLPISKTIAMVALDRLLDLVGLLAVVLVTIGVFTPQDGIIPKETFGREIPFSASQIRWGEFAAGTMLFVTVIPFVLLYVRQNQVLALTERFFGRISKRLGERVRLFLQHFVEGLHIFRSGSDMLKACLFSLATWGVCILVFQAMIFAFNIECPWYTAIVMEMLLAVAISVPGPPGFIGQFHAPIVICLVILSTADDPTAKAFAILTHIINLVPIAVIGFFCIITERFSVTELAHESSATKKQIKQADRAVGD